MSRDAATFAAHFEALFESDSDPWQYRTRWYEVRKRAVLMAALPASRYPRGYEPACAGGELTAELANRCEQLLATDGSHAAIAQAELRNAGRSHVRFEQAFTPSQWPPGAFELIVVSELGYYLQDEALDELIGRSQAALARGGTLVVCHWRHRAHDFLHSGDEVQARFAANTPLARVVRHEEADFLLDVWSRDDRSVAQREGFV